MKNVWIGLLIAAAGTGIFFLLRNGKRSGPKGSIDIEQVLGQWKTDIKSPGDTVSRTVRYAFEKDGLLLTYTDTTGRADSAYYAWMKDGRLEWKKSKSDSSGLAFTVKRNGNDTLRLVSADSLETTLVRVK